MSSVRRVYVEKKPDFAVAAKELRHEIRNYLGLKGVTGVIIAQNLWVMTVFSILAWGIFVVFRYIRCSRLMKTSITVALCGVWMFFANTLISVAYNRVVRPSVNFHNWMDFGGQNIGLVVLIVGAVMIAASMIRDIRR